MRHFLLRVLIIAVIVYFNFIVQTTLFEYISIYNIKPNSAILLTVCVAILFGELPGAVTGFCSGLLVDIFFGQYLGLSALTGLLIGFLCGKPFKTFYRENFLFPVILVLTSCVFHEFIFYVANFMFRARLDFWYYMRAVMLPAAIYTTFLTVPVYYLMHGLQKRMYRGERPV